MESLKEIIAKEVKKPKELLKQTKAQIQWMIGFVEVLEKETKNYLAELSGGSLLATQAEKTKARLLEQEQKLQTMAEVLHNTLGEEFASVREDWPEDFVSNLSWMDKILQDLIGTDYKSGDISYFGECVRKSANSNDVKSILNALDRIKNFELGNLTEAAAVEEAVFERDLQLAINNHVGKDFQQHAALYAGELASTCNDFLRKKYKFSNEPREVAVKAETKDQEIKDIPRYPRYILTILFLRIDFFKKVVVHGLHNFKTVDAEINYDIPRRAFELRVKEWFEATGASDGYYPTRHDSIDEAFEQLRKWVLS